MKFKTILAMTLAAGFALNAAAEHLGSINPAYIDKTTAPGTDFYTHVNRGWMESHPLTAEHARYPNVR